jgi:hypothetical protein
VDSPAGSGVGKLDNGIVGRLKPLLEQMVAARRRYRKPFLPSMVRQARRLRGEK